MLVLASWLDGTYSCDGDDDDSNGAGDDDTSDDDMILSVDFECSARMYSVLEDEYYGSVETWIS